jgi:peptidoglycan/xylan/chitin deacetylase (PgdA/CDA1 family)
VASLKDAKLAVLRAGKATGLFTASTHLRTQRLLILCYHGIAVEDEYQWNPCLYIDPGTFRARLEMLRDGGYRVLPLGEALSLMNRNRLPSRSVVITFDDGTYDFYEHAYPMLREFGFPVTLYLSTFYCRHQAPVFDVAWAYMLWKSIGRTFDATGLAEGGGEIPIRDVEEWQRIRARTLHYVHGLSLAAREKDELLNTLAARLNFDITRIRSRRMLHYMTPDEVGEISRGGVDIQLHTHRHRMPRDRELFRREILDNIHEIREMTGTDAKPSHFCYPCGDYDPTFYGWLKELGVESATTCQPGLAASSTHPFELPRLLDMPTLSSLEFEGWLTGFSEVFPRRDARALHIQREQE